MMDGSESRIFKKKWRLTLSLLKRPSSAKMLRLFLFFSRCLLCRPVLLREIAACSLVHNNGGANLLFRVYGIHEVSWGYVHMIGCFSHGHCTCEENQSCSSWTFGYLPHVLVVIRLKRFCGPGLKLSRTYFVFHFQWVLTRVCVLSPRVEKLCMEWFHEDHRFRYSHLYTGTKNFMFSPSDAAPLLAQGSTYPVLPKQVYCTRCEHTTKHKVPVHSLPHRREQVLLLCWFVCSLSKGMKIPPYKIVRKSNTTCLVTFLLSVRIRSTCSFFSWGFHCWRTETTKSLNFKQTAWFLADDAPPVRPCPRDAVCLRMRT